jgi:hypothetical protein
MAKEELLPRVWIKGKQWIFDEKKKLLIDPQNTDRKVPITKFQLENLKWYMGELGELREETEKLKEIAEDVRKKLTVLERLEVARKRSASKQVKEVW